MLRKLLKKQMPPPLTMPISWTTASQVDDAGADADRSAGGQGR